MPAVMRGLAVGTLGLLVALRASFADNAVQQPRQLLQPLASLGVEDVKAVLRGWHLDALSECFVAEQVDGDTLAHANEADFEASAAACPQARPHHWRKFWRRLGDVRAEGGDMLVHIPAVSPKVAEVRTLMEQEVTAVSGDSESSSAAPAGVRRRMEAAALGKFSGVAINIDDSMVAFGADLDAVLFRSAPRELTVNGTIRAQSPEGAVVSLADVGMLQEHIANLTAQVNALRANITVLESHDYVYTWFEGVRVCVWVEGGGRRELLLCTRRC